MLSEPSQATSLNLSTAQQSHPRPCRSSRIKPHSTTPPSTAPRKQLLILHIPNKLHTYHSENSSKINEEQPSAACDRADGLQNTSHQNYKMVTLSPEFNQAVVDSKKLVAKPTNDHLLVRHHQSTLPPRLSSLSFPQKANC